MATTKKRYGWALQWYVMTHKRRNAAGQPIAQCGPYAVLPDAEAMLVIHREKTGDPTLFTKQLDINRMAIRPTRLEEI